MQITLTRRGDYGIRAVLDLARHEGAGRRKKREIAAAMEIPSGFLSQILATLVRADLVRAAAGPDGGYVLARPAAAISLLDVVEAVEGPVALRRCLLRGIPCASDEPCAVHDAWARAQDATTGVLGATSFDALARS